VAEKEFLPMQTGAVPRTYASTAELERDLISSPAPLLRMG